MLHRLSLPGSFLIGGELGTSMLPGGVTGASGAAPQTTTTVTVTDNGPVMSTAPLVLSVVADNTGTPAATTVNLAVTLDSSLTYVSASGTGWTCSQTGGVVTCTRASMSSGAAPTITINVTSGSATKTTSTTASLTAANAPTSTGSDAASVLLVSQDATSGIRCPASATEWTNVMSIAGLATGNPSALWLMQEASGNPADSIGTFTLTKAGTVGYNGAVSGWTRTGLTTTDGTAGMFSNAASGLPDISTTSALVLAYVSLPASFGAVERSIITLGPTFGSQICANSYPSSNPSKLSLAQLGGSFGGYTTEAATATTGVHPVLLQLNHTAGVPYMVTDKDATTTTLYAGQTGKAIAFGGTNVQEDYPDTGDFMYAAMFFGSAAEMTKAQMKTLLQTLGWTVAWS